MTRASIIIAERCRDSRPDVSDALARIGCRITAVSGASDIASAVERCRPEIGIVEEAPDARWRETAALLRRLDPRIKLILLAANSCQALAIEALRAGFDDYLALPCEAADVIAAVQRCRQHSAARHEAGGNRAGSTRDRDRDDGVIRGDRVARVPALVGASPATSRLREDLRRLGASDGNVLITGETGTGKELVAELIHASSPRRARPFVSVNCAAVPDSLLESELFGYERGAFTNADAARAGRLEEAHGGILFLDEIGDMTPAGQAKILRVTDGKEWCRLGGRREIRADLRFVAATNQDLEALMTGGRFRRDLYFRLNVARVELTPLRERREDVPALLDHYLRGYNTRFDYAVEGLTDEALDALTNYDWPGNVRELRNVVQMMSAGRTSGRIGISDLPGSIAHGLPIADTSSDEERARLLGALTATRWNKSKAAAQLHWSRMTIYRKMVKYGVTNGTGTGTGGV